MNTYKIVVNPQAKHGFDLIVIDESNNETRKSLTSKTTDGYLRVTIPEYNIKMVSLKEINKNLDENGEYVLQPKTMKNYENAINNYINTIDNAMEYIRNAKPANANNVSAALYQYDIALGYFKPFISEELLTNLVDKYLDICEYYKFDITLFSMFNEAYCEAQI